MHKRSWQFSLGALFVLIAVISSLLSVLATGGSQGFWVGAPIALAGIAVLFGAHARGLRKILLLVAVGGTLFSLLQAGRNYPIIVIADSDLGAGAMRRVGDWLLLTVVGVLAVVLVSAGFFMNRVNIRLGLSLAFLGWVATLQFRSDDTSPAARMGPVALAGLMLAVDALTTLARRYPKCTSSQRTIVTVAIPAILLLTNWQGRIYLGLIPSSYHARSSADDEALRTSVSLMAGKGSQVSVSHLARLRARGDEQGSLFVESLDGGAGFHRPPDVHDRIVTFVLFSPDGRLLVSGDNVRWGDGNALTIWDVAAGQAGAAPDVKRRHVLEGGTHAYWSASFFPDSKTLLSSKQDGTITLSDAKSGQKIGSFFPFGNFVSDCVSASPDGKSFATWASPGLKVWDRASLRLLRSMETPGSTPIALAYTTEGSALLAADRERVSYWKLSPSPVPFVALVILNVAIVVWIAWPTTRPSGMGAS